MPALRWAVIPFVACLALMLPATRPAETELPELFDPARHLAVSDVRPGMTGHGLTVFAGTDIEPFAVRVVGVLRNTQQLDTGIVLIECDDPRLDVSGPVQGMSGSPVYLRGDDGRDRLIGAFAFGWSFSKRTIVGVQPIEAMLRLDADGGDDATPAAADPVPAATAMAWFDLPDGDGATPDGLPGAVPLRVPLASPGLTPLAAEVLAEGLPPTFAPMAGGGAGGDESIDAPIEPGSALVVPLVTGDLELSAVGTCTEVIDGRVFGFGHPLFDAGPSRLPLAGGRVDAVIPLYSTSFKIGTSGPVAGTLLADGTSGIAGTLGDPPPMIPMTVDVGGQSFDFRAADAPDLLPNVAAAAVAQAVALTGGIDRDGGLRWAVELTYAEDGAERAVRLADVAAARDGGVANATQTIAGFMSAVAGNPFDQVDLRGMTASVEPLPPSAVRVATILAATPVTRTLAPGEDAAIDVTFEPFDGGRMTRRLTLPLPDDLEPGEYEIAVVPASDAIYAELGNRPNLAAVDSASELLDLADLVGTFRSDRVYLVLRPTEAADLAIDGRVLADLPPSRRLLLATAGDPDVREATPAVVEAADVPFVVTEGSAAATVTVERR